MTEILIEKKKKFEGPRTAVQKNMSNSKTRGRQNTKKTKKVVSSPQKLNSSSEELESNPVKRVSSQSSQEEELEIYNPNNRLLTREFVEKTLSKLCGYGIRIGSLELYQLAFVHKSVYRKDISPPASVVEDFLKRSGLERVPDNPPLPVATYRHAIPGPSSTTKSRPVIFCDTYEAIEFVGDGWIGAVIGQYVKSRFPQQSEGFYHNLKKYIVCKDGLSTLSDRLGFGDYALLSPQAEDLLTRKNIGLLEDIFEAFCCSVVEDLGVGVLRVIVKNLIESTIDFRDAIINDTNYKDILKRICRENGWPQPVYIELGDNGKMGAKKEYSVGIKLFPEAASVGVRGKMGFTLKGEVCDLWSTGNGPVKKKAQQSAAFNALKCLELTLQQK
jgi:dsRNA-specific ribonuclease